MLFEFAAESPRPSARACIITPANVRCSTCTTSKPKFLRALSRRVDLKSGGYLMIDQTESDDHHRRQHRRLRRRPQFPTTPSSAPISKRTLTIARQLRLRNLGGIIIIDFIDMEKRRTPRSRTQRTEKPCHATHPRHHERLLATGPGRNDPQTHPESLAHVLCEPVPGVRRQRPTQNPAYRVLTTCCAKSCASRASSIRANSVWVAAQAVIDLFLEEEVRSIWRCCAILSASRFRCRWSRI